MRITTLFALLLGLSSCLATNTVIDGRTIQMTDNGAWCWYQDERAIVDLEHPEGPMLLASSISFGPKGSAEAGDCDVNWIHLRTGEQGQFELHDRLESDDHDNAALWIRPDGRYLAVYTKHSSDKDVRWRISKNPHDPTAWEDEQKFTNSVHTCYSNVFELEGPNGTSLLYDFVRSNGFDPNWFVSADQGQTWSYGGKLHTGPSGNDARGQRPYVKYAAHGKERLHFITTDGHPRNEDNNIYHGSLSRGQLYNSEGTVLGPLSETERSPLGSNDFTTVFQTGTHFGGTELRRAWTVDMAVDAEGHPYAAMTARAKDSNLDHRFLYGRWNGSQWNVAEIAEAGSYLYKAEDDYTGLVALHPRDPNVLVLSTPIDPRDRARLKNYELFMGRTADAGAHWTWSPITWESGKDNLRPVIPDWDGENTAVLWLQGRINSYFSWESSVMLRAIPTGDLDDLIVPGQKAKRQAARLPDSWGAK
ncbi:MAG: BNR-4 repeat-containing protein [Planctomycetota bacterium]|nr:BNR-4 repeat-containing protein [Planctomycetota bacterium]